MTTLDEAFEVSPAGIVQCAESIMNTEAQCGLYRSFRACRPDGKYELLAVTLDIFELCKGEVGAPFIMTQLSPYFSAPTNSARPVSLHYRTLGAYILALARRCAAHLLLQCQCVSTESESDHHADHDTHPIIDQKVTDWKSLLEHDKFHRWLRAFLVIYNDFDPPTRDGRYTVQLPTRSSCHPFTASSEDSITVLEYASLKEDRLPVPVKVRRWDAILRTYDRVYSVLIIR